MWIQGRLTLLPRVVQHFVKSLHWWQHAGGSWVTNSAPVSTGVCSSSSPVILWISASICLLRHDFNTHTLKYCLCSFTTNYFFFSYATVREAFFFFFKVLCVGRLFPLWVSIQHSKGLMTRCLKGWRLRTSVLISLIVFSFSPPLPRTSQKETSPCASPLRAQHSISEFGTEKRKRSCKEKQTKQNSPLVLCPFLFLLCSKWKFRFGNQKQIKSPENI